MTMTTDSPESRLFAELAELAPSLKKIYQDELQDPPILPYFVLNRFSTFLYLELLENPSDPSGLVHRAVDVVEKAWQLNENSDSDVRNLIISEFAAVFAGDDPPSVSMRSIVHEGLSAAIDVVRQS